MNSGYENEHNPTFVSQLIEPKFLTKLIELLREYRDCFAWDYDEMPGLSRELVECRLPIREGCRPFKQQPRRMSPEVTLKVKDKIERLLKAGFIRTAWYIEWLSNVVLVVKKNGNLRVCINFWDPNLVTPKDEYPMPVADQRVDAMTKHQILSLMDGHSGYN